MHFHQYVFSILVLSAYTTAFYVWNSDSAVESPGSKDENVEKRAPFYTWRDEPTESDGTDSNPPTLKIKRKPQKVAESLHARIQREVDYVANKYGRRNLKESSVKGNGDTARQHQPRGSPVKRDNQYSIETAAPASQTNSVAVHQDGTDFSYFASIALGSEGKEMYVLIDSGAANTWVMGADCTTRACNAHNTFGKEDSDTLEVLDKEWSVSYGTGDVSGVIFNDTVSLAGFTIPFSFGGALEASDDFLNYPMDGILGLGRAASNELDVPTIMDVLSQEKKLKANLFGVNLQRHADGATDGEVTFGEWDESKFEGDLKWISSTAKDGLWEIQIDDVSVGDEGVGFKGKKAVIDTGTSFILLPPSDAQKLHAQIPDASIKGATYDLPCSTTANLRFTFAGVGYDVPPKDYVGNTTSGDRCLSNIIPRQYSGPDNWLMGDTFLKNVYAVFDFDQDRIGKPLQPTPRL
ncbi:MAG: hypothetical protein M1837_000425 [Sclerophora amabilis]|nr:MAG: hypothetical protein M1837_000425 [Sclerophora amabilis]